MLKALTGIPEWGYYVAWYKMSGGYYPYSPRPEGPCPPKVGFSPLSMSGEKGTKKCAGSFFMTFCCLNHMM